MHAEELLDAISKVVRYNWDDEARDWQECRDNDNKNEILATLYELARFAGMKDQVAEYEALTSGHARAIVWAVEPHPTLPFAYVVRHRTTGQRFRLGRRHYWTRPEAGKIAAGLNAPDEAEENGK